MPAAGKVFYRGDDVTGAPSYSLVERGLALVPEGRGVFGRLTVEENLLMGAYTRNDAAAVKRDLRACLRAVSSPEGAAPPNRWHAVGRRAADAGDRACAHERTHLALLDEPSMGLAPLMVQRIFDTIRKVASEGVTVLLVEQNAKLALEVSQRGYVMESGLITLTDTSAALLANPQVRQAYLGE